MIKPKELRIGDWFIDYEAEPEVTIYWQVEEICKLSENSKNQQLGVRYRNGSCWTLEPLPIELTEDIIIRLGFESVQELACWLDDKSYDNGFSVKFYHQDGINKLLSLPLHKLQNLIYCLTGKQLTLKQE